MAAPIICLSTRPRAHLVKPDVAQKQFEMETATPAGPAAGDLGARTPSDIFTVRGGSPPDFQDGSSSKQVRPKRFHGSVTLDATRVGRDAGRIDDEVVAHLSGLVGSTVTVTLSLVRSFTKTETTR
jgi:hypothetical protein